MTGSRQAYWNPGLPTIETIQDFNIMWNVYVVDENGVFKANSIELGLCEAEYFASLLDPSLSFFLLPIGGGFIGLCRIRLDPKFFGIFCDSICDSIRR